MLSNRITILSTRPLSKALIEKAAQKKILIEEIPFIKTQPLENELLTVKINELSQKPLTVVFTSMNAVEAIAPYLKNKTPGWKIYSIGFATKNLIKETFGDKALAGTADSAIHLADLIIDQKDTSSVIFFCGDKRREELPEQLKKHGIEVNEIMVYKTIELTHTLEHAYDAVLFYSPSAVDSFFSSNTIGSETILFAIGHTTANEIKKYVKNKIITAKQPSKELLVEEAINYFQPIHH